MLVSLGNQPNAPNVKTSKVVIINEDTFSQSSLLDLLPLTKSKQYNRMLNYGQLEYSNMILNIYECSEVI